MHAKNVLWPFALGKTYVNRKKIYIMAQRTLISLLWTLLYQLSQYKNMASENNIPHKHELGLVKFYFDKKRHLNM